MQAALGVGKKMFPAFIEDPVIAYRLQQIADTLLCTIMEKNVLAEQVVEPVLTRLLQRLLIQRSSAGCRCRLMARK